ncbi:MAG: TlpA family protein disulfide reductase [Alphaproteobacteria bacterium]|jgi:thiol-disulfide isomerase/thioredoxin|nr:TlpA family protein disulfide reductase [Alphaproteobacteria bacterium]
MLKKSLFVIFTVLCVSGWGWGKNDRVNIYDSPRELPERKMFLHEEGGKSISLSGFEGQFVIAIFWSRYCAPCIKELEKLSAFQKKTKGDDIKIVMISPSSDWISSAEQRRFLTQFKAGDLTYYVDKKGDLAADLGIFTSPNTVFVNANGLEIGRIRGAIEWDRDEMVEYVYNLKAEHNNDELSDEDEDD